MATTQVQWIRKSKSTKAAKRQQQPAQRVEQQPAWAREQYWQAVYASWEG